MKTNTVILSAKFDHYSLPVPAGRVRGFFAFMRSHYTFEQFKYLAACGEFLLRNKDRTAYTRTRLSSIPLSPTSCGMTNSFRFLHCPAMSIGGDWKIELKFRTGASNWDDEGNPEKFLKWADFPGEVEIGFSFVEE